MQRHSRDRGEIIPYDLGDPSLLEGRSISTLLQGNLPRTINCAAGKGSIALHAVIMNLSTLDAGKPYDTVAHAITEMFFSAAARQNLGLPPDAVWYMTAKVFPTSKALRDAGIKDYCISNRQEVMRAVFVVPIGTDNAILELRDATGSSRNVSARTIGSTGINIIPPSLTKPNDIFATTVSSRRHETPPHSYIVAFQVLFTIPNDTKITPQLFYGINLSQLPVIASCAPREASETRTVVWENGKIVRKRMVMAADNTFDTTIESDTTVAMVTGTVVPATTNAPVGDDGFGTVLEDARPVTMAAEESSWEEYAEAIESVYQGLEVPPMETTHAATYSFNTVTEPVLLRTAQPLADDYEWE